MDQNKSAKRLAAETRQSDYNALTIQERVAKLDAKLGVGVGAVKERAKLAAKLANPQRTIKKAPAPVSIDDQLQSSGYDPLTGTPENQ